MLKNMEWQLKDIWSSPI